jgi:hypothetical protein
MRHFDGKKQTKFDESVESDEVLDAYGQLKYGGEE